MTAARDVVMLGLSITSSWGNGHATTYRALAKALRSAGHRVTFLERDVPWYAENRDLPAPPYCETFLYGSLAELRERHEARVRDADLVLVGSFVPDGVEVARWARARARGQVAFYDIDTPATLASLEAGTCAYLDRGLVPGFDVYLSFTGGPTLARLERDLGAQRARPLYCSFDPDHYSPLDGDGDGGVSGAGAPPRWDLGYMGTYSADRQPALEALCLAPAREARARRFVVAGPMYPPEIRWPSNVERLVHLAPDRHRAFYCAQRLTLNLTRAPMLRAGYSPSVRLFEAAACGVAIVSDAWRGLELFFEPGREILVARDGRDVTRYLADIGDDEAARIGARARARVLAEHTAAHRARELLAHVFETTTVAA